MLNRTVAPKIHSIDSINFEQPHSIDITPYCQLVSITNVQNNTAKFELFFDAGTTKEQVELASITNGMLLSGTNKKNSIQINEQIDKLGGFVEQGIGMEVASIGMYSLSEHLLELARIVFEAIDQCVFDDRELKQLLQNRQQKLNVSLEKVSVLAQRMFKENFFANSPKYKKVTHEKDLEAVQQKELVRFHKQYYLQGLRKIVLVGNFTQQEVEQFADLFRHWAIKKESIFEQNFENNKGLFHHQKKEAIQSAIRIGRPLFNKTHRDYIDFMVLNTILGDYFGSRLMRNIREDKGYTYGIGTAVQELEKTGYWMIGTEVAVEVKENTLQEIQREIEILQKTKISNEELGIVKNYIVGQLLKSADGPYSMMDLYLDVDNFNLDMNFYNKMIKSIYEVSPERLQQLAKQYLNWEEFTVVTAGGE